MNTDQSLLDAINSLISQTTAIPPATITPLNFVAPTGQDMDSKWLEFLNKAASDPDVIKYYQDKLNQAQGDTNTAIAFIDKDYQTGTRQRMETLKGTLASLGLTSLSEQQNLQDSLNKRGIALTQEQGGPVTYAGGGVAGSELGKLNQAQSLRKEAEVRSAQNDITNSGLTREKGITSANQALTNTSQGIKEAQDQAIFNRANTYYGMYQDQKNAELQQKMYGQEYKKNNINKSDINPSTGKAYAINPSTGNWDDNWFSQTYG